MGLHQLVDTQALEGDSSFFIQRLDLVVQTFDQDEDLYDEDKVRHAETPELAREALVDSAVLIYRSQIEVAFREQTAGHNALLLFVGLALQLMEEQLFNAFKELDAKEAEVNANLAWKSIFFSQSSKDCQSAAKGSILMINSQVLCLGNGDFMGRIYLVTIPETQHLTRTANHIHWCTALLSDYVTLTGCATGHGGQGEGEGSQQAEEKEGEKDVQGGGERGGRDCAWQAG